MKTSSSESIMLDLFERISNQRRWYVEFQYWNELHISIVGDYLYNLSTTCDFPEFPSAQLLITNDPLQWTPQMLDSFKQELREIFVVPRLNALCANLINKCELIEAFLSFLLQLLYHKTDLIVDSFKDRIENIEKELRFLLTILGDISWMLLDRDELEAEFQNLLPEFEAVANRAGSFVHYLFFSSDRSFGKTDDGLASVLKNTHLLKANLQSSISASAFTTPTTSIVDSILILDSVVDDLEDLLKREDDPIAEVKDQVKFLHQGLMLSHSLINEMRSPQPSEIGEAEEPLMRIGGIARQAEYLITSFLVKDAPLCYVFNRLTHLSHGIEPIIKELKLITQTCKLGSLKVAEETLQDKTKTEVNGVSVGFEDKTTDILDQLVGGSKSLQVISIMGMAGLGKTTLANKLYNHRSVSHRFDKLSWCVVSQTYERKRVLANILIHINSEFDKDSILNMEEIRLVEHIHKTLMGRRYLIVLDDIWDSNVSDELLRCFQDDGNGSRILLTSRNKDVAPSNSIIHELPFLSDEECWELLEKKVFGSRPCPPQLQRIGKEISAECRGLPLKVVVIAGVLSSVDEEESRWKEVRGSLASFADNSVMQILELSYKHLPDHLKPCFLYFGEFKEDQAISVGNLKRLWVAEGFIRKEKDKSAENIAGEYLMVLINRSLVMMTKDGRGAKSCVVHDLLHELCLKKCKEESFLKSVNSSIFNKGNRIRALGNSTSTLSYCQHVRSIVGERQPSSLYVRDMRLLRVLYYKDIYFPGLTFGIEYLVNLRFLVIHNLPPQIDSLVNLEYLRMELCFGYQLPVIVNMKKLRYIWAYSAVYGDDWNRYQTNNLEYLSLVTIRKLKDEELLKCSPRLRKLKCNYNQEGMDKSVYPHFDLSFLTQLDSLCLVGSLSNRDFGFPSNIRKLTLLKSGLLWEKMSIVGKLQNLEVLKLSSDAFVGERWDTIYGEFQKLRFLQLDDIQLSEWNVASNEHFPKLQQLILISCCNLREIPCEIGEITTLDLIEVKEHVCLSLVESAERIEQEQLDMGNEDLRVIISADTD